MANILQSGQQVMAGRSAFSQGQKEQKDDLRELCNEGIEKVGNDPELLAAYLGKLATITNYGYRNVMTIYQQKPDAEFVDSPKGWYEKGRYVPADMKDKGIYIIKPVEKQGRTYFDPKMVYDLSHTVGRPVQKPVQLEEDSPQMQKAFDALMESAPVPIVPDENLPMPAVYDSREKVIRVNGGFSDYETFAAVVNATAHASLHRDDIRATGGTDRGYDPASFEFITACTTYVVSKRFGVPVPGMDFETPVETLGMMDIEGKDAMLKIIGEAAQKVGDKVQERVQPKTKGKGARPLDYAR